MTTREGRVRPGAWCRLLAGAVLLSSACTGGATDSGPVVPSAVAAAPTPTSEAPTTTSAASPSPVATTSTGEATSEPANATALDFTARRLEGGTLDGVQLAGRHVALWMWAPWCPQCNREAPHVADAVAALGDDVTVVGVAGHDTDDAHRAFVDEHGLGEVLHLVDDDGSLWARYGVTYQPAWVLVHADGRVEHIAGGLYEGIEPRLRELAAR